MGTWQVWMKTAINDLKGLFQPKQSKRTLVVKVHQKYHRGFWLQDGWGDERSTPQELEWAEPEVWEEFSTGWAVQRLVRRRLNVDTSPLYEYTRGKQQKGAFPSTGKCLQEVNKIK